jgi:hypothetical protein
MVAGGPALNNMPMKSIAGKTMAISSPLSPRILCANLSFYTRPGSPSKITKKSQSLATLACSISQTFTSCPFSRAIRPDLTAAHVDCYGELLTPGQWVGVGSVCKRNGNPDQIEDILLSIKAQRPDLRLHGFGIKLEALKSATVRQLLHSSDSMAWSFAGRKSGIEHDPRIALAYAAKIEALISFSLVLFNPNFSIGGTKRTTEYIKAFVRVLTKRKRARTRLQLV